MRVQNVTIASIPTTLSPGLAPPGKHLVHAYTAGNEPYEIWEGLDRRSPEYKRLKVHNMIHVDASGTFAQDKVVHVQQGTL